MYSVFLPLLLSFLGCRCIDPSAASKIQLGETNVLLIINCTLRADRLQSYGYEVPSSPYWQKRSEQAMIFDSHISQAPWTRPSLGSIMTGQYPRSLGLDNPADSGSFDLLLKEEVTTIAEIFQQQNYFTIGATGNPNAKTQFGLAQGFMSYHEPDKTFRERARLPNTKEMTDFILQEQQGKEAVFVQLITVDTHQRVQFEDEDFAVVQDYHPQNWKKQRKTRLSATYDASVHYLDRQLQDFIEDFIEERPNTVIIQTADHGEGLLDPEHHGRGHGRYLYPSTIRIPHMWLHPSLPRGVRVQTVTRNIDIFPTLLELFQLPEQDDIAGESYLSLFHNPNADLKKVAFVETFYGTEHKVALYDSEYYWIADKKREEVELYSFADKEALHDLSVEQAEKMLAYQQAEKALIERWPLLLQSPSGEMDAKIKEQLEAIGYIE